MSRKNIASQLRVAEAELAYLQPLGEAELLKLAEQLAQARRMQHDDMREAAEKAVSQLPMIMRKPLQKMFKGF